MKKLVYLLPLLALVACNKEKRFSKRLMRKETWLVKAIVIDGTKSQVNGVWTISKDVDIYDSIPNASWSWKNQDAVANWQFQDKGKSSYCPLRRYERTMYSRHTDIQRAIRKR